ncbi:hypothetical protein [Larkinella arboricola]
MKLFTQSCLLVASFVFLFGSCTLQDHQLPPTSATCLLYQVAELYQVMDGSNPEDIIEVDGQKIPVKTSSYTSYKYDEQGRIIEKYNVLDKWRTYYEYLTKDIKWTSVPDPDRPYAVSTTAILGLDSRGLFANAANVFDSEGFRTYFNEGTWKLYTTITDGNITKTERTEVRWFTTTEYEYDLTQPNKIPNPEPFYGKTSRNMLIREKYNAVDSKGERFYSITDYKYFYNQNGQVKYRVGLKKTYSPYLVEQPAIQYTITSYTITCQ